MMRGRWSFPTGYAAHTYMDILIILLLILVNAVFAMSEIAIVSSRRVRLQQLADDGDAGARVALELGDHPTGFLSTVQVFITLITLTSGVYGEAKLTERLLPLFESVPFLAHNAKLYATICMLVGVTYLSLVIGELVPKRLGMQTPERIARRISRPMKYLSVAAHPLVKLLSFSTDFVLGLLRLKHHDEPPVTEEEIKVLMAEGAEAGVFEPTERDMVENVFRLDDWRLSLIMTTRMDIEYLDLDQPWAVQQETLLKAGHSYLPVCRGSFNNVVGVLSLKDMLLQQLRGETPDIAVLAKEPLFAPMSMSPLALLELFKDKRQHLALVVDEYGDVQGLVTLKDLLEAVVGEFEDDGNTDPDIVKRADGSLLLDGALSIERFKELFPLESDILEEGSRDYQTLAGLVLFLLGRVPQTGDLLEWQGLRIEVLDMDRNRIDKLLVQRATPPH